MNSPRVMASSKPLLSAAAMPSGRLARPGARFAVVALVLAVCFSMPLYGLVRYALSSELYSHILLIPLISAYLIWLKWGRGMEDGGRISEVIPLPPSSAGQGDQRSKVRGQRTEGGFGAALISFMVAMAALGCYWLARWRGWQPGQDDSLAVAVLSFLLLLVAAGLMSFGKEVVSKVAFPVAMLFFMIPFPHLVKNGIEMFFQHTSADAASILFSVSGTPVFRDGLVFHLPGMTIRVAEECSGIRSSLVLFITGLLAAYLFLRSPWKRAILALIVIPLGIARNGFRIFTIGMLCVHVDPGMINSPLHRRGGPVFFLLSLIPFFLVLIWLRRTEGVTGKG